MNLASYFLPINAKRMSKVAATMSAWLKDSSGIFALPIRGDSLYAANIRNGIVRRRVDNFPILFHRLNHIISSAVNKLLLGFNLTRRAAERDLFDRIDIGTAA